MTISRHHLLAFLIGSWLAGASITAWALKPDNITDAEMAALPPYCADSQTFKQLDQVHYSPTTRKWVGVMGVGFFHIHHYCWALINYKRALSPRMSRYERGFLLKDVRGDFWYPINNTDSTFILLPELYTWVGRTSILLYEPQAALHAFAKAKSLKPDYWPPYFYWAEFLRTQGKKAEALEVVKSGLQYSPGAKPLLLLYRDLGGKPSDIPPPIAKPADAPEPSPDQPAEASPTPDTDSKK